MHKILFRVEAGEEVGLGHLQRCLSLASALKELGIESIFAATGGRKTKERIEHSGFEVVLMSRIRSGSQADLQFVSGVAKNHSCSAVVTDCYAINAAYQTKLRLAPSYVVAIDDLGVPPFTADLIINGGVLGTSLPYHEAPKDSSCLLGARYALLGEQYLNIPLKENGNNVDRILITMGGADPEDFTSRLIIALDLLTEEFDLEIIVGPFNLHRQSIKETICLSKRHINIHYSPASLYDLILSTQMAISAAGQTLYELAATGTPTIAIQTAGNQALNIAGFTEHGCTLQAAPSRQESMEEVVASQVRCLLANPIKRNAMGLAGQQLVDGQGATRAARAISQLINNDAPD